MYKFGDAPKLKKIKSKVLWSRYVVNVIARQWRLKESSDGEADISRSMVPDLWNSRGENRPYNVIGYKLVTSAVFSKVLKALQF